MSIERRFDVPFISALALREKSIQQNYRPVIAVHKWFARRPGALFRGLLLSEFVDAALQDSYFRSNTLQGKRVADPFMGGGTPLIEANRLGAEIAGWDVNPMAWWIVGRELEDLDVAVYEEAGKALIQELRRQVGVLYETSCTRCGESAPVKCFLWVKTQACTACRRRIDLFPGYLVATNARHPKNILVCAACGGLAEVSDRKSPGACSQCAAALRSEGPARRGLVPCPHCGAPNRYPATADGPLPHRMFAIEYHCRGCRQTHRGRFFKSPTDEDLAKYAAAARRLEELAPTRYVPDDPIPPGDESTRLHRWGYSRYRQMFNDRQLLGLELSCHLVATQSDPVVNRALATNLSDLLRYNNLLVRYDTSTLKALDLFSVHGFPTGLVRCEVNLLGILDRNKPVGSGGWVNILHKYKIAKEYCDRPFEVPPGARTRVYTTGERIGVNGGDAIHDGVPVRANGRNVMLICDSATTASLTPNSLDAVLTDPPYYDSVQYAELMDFCYVWLRRLARTNGVFNPPSTRTPGELTGNRTERRGIEHFTEGLAQVYVRMADALRPGAPFVFTYHHNQQSAYHPVAVAILDAGLVATATLPCPAEMSGSIHINGTRSSIVDTVFVCRKDAAVPADDLAFGPEDFARLVAFDLAQLRAGGVRPSAGDARCIALGHLVRMAAWTLRPAWNRKWATTTKLHEVRNATDDLASVEGIMEVLQSTSVTPGTEVQGDFLEDINGV